MTGVQTCALPISSRTIFQCVHPLSKLVEGFLAGALTEQMEVLQNFAYRKKLSTTALWLKQTDILSRESLIFAFNGDLVKAFHVHSFVAFYVFQICSEQQFFDDRNSDQQFFDDRNSDQQFFDDENSVQQLLFRIINGGRSGQQFFDDENSGQQFFDDENSGQQFFDDENSVQQLLRSSIKNGRSGQQFFDDENSDQQLLDRI